MSGMTYFLLLLLHRIWECNNLRHGAYLSKESYWGTITGDTWLCAFITVATCLLIWKILTMVIYMLTGTTISDNKLQMIFNTITMCINGADHEPKSRGEFERLDYMWCWNCRCQIQIPGSTSSTRKSSKNISFWQLPFSRFLEKALKVNKICMKSFSIYYSKLLLNCRSTPLVHKNTHTQHKLCEKTILIYQLIRFS